MKIYIAARYTRREEMVKIADTLIEEGFEVTARWVYGEEEGLTRKAISAMDLEDVEKADIILSFTEPYGTPVPGGGRHVEFGYGLARGKEVAIVGERENVFHWDSHVAQFDTVEEFIDAYR